MRSVLSVKLAVTLDIDVGLHRAEWNDVTELWPNPNYPGLEATHPVARAAVASDLIVEIADHANLKLLRHELRPAPVEVHIYAVLILGIWIDGVVGKAEHP